MSRATSGGIRPPSNRTTDHQAQLGAAAAATAATATAAATAAGGTGTGGTGTGQSSPPPDRTRAGGISPAAGTTEHNEAVRSHVSVHEAAPVKPADRAAGLDGQRFSLRCRRGKEAGGREEN